MRISRPLTLLAGLALALLTSASLAAAATATSRAATANSGDKRTKRVQIGPTFSRTERKRLLSEARSTPAARLPASTVNLCKIRDDAGNCLHCIRDYFLSGSSCQAVPPASLIPHCNIYSSPASCYKCDSGFAPSSDTKSCGVLTKLPNCDVQYNSIACASCVAGSYLKSSGACSAVVAGCSVALSETACSRCASDYYLSGTACTSLPLANRVPNCLSYGPNLKCASCNQGFALDITENACWDQSQMSQQIDPRCIDTVVNTGQSCNICRQGYYLEGGSCKQITTDPVEACFITNWKNPTQCLICMTGFQINSDNKCSVQANSPSGQANPLSARVLSALAAALVGVLLLTN